MPTVEVSWEDDQWLVYIEGHGQGRSRRLSDVCEVAKSILENGQTDTTLDIRIDYGSPLHPGYVGRLQSARSYVDGEEEVAVTTTHGNGSDFAWIHYIEHGGEVAQVTSMPLELAQLRDLQQALPAAGRVVAFSGEVRESGRTGIGTPDFGALLGQSNLPSVDGAGPQSHVMQPGS
jgi:hypothetical protein